MLCFVFEAALAWKKIDHICPAFFTDNHTLVAGEHKQLCQTVTYNVCANNRFIHPTGKNYEERYFVHQRLRGTCSAQAAPSEILP